MSIATFPSTTRPGGTQSNGTLRIAFAGCGSFCALDLLASRGAFYDMEPWRDWRTGEPKHLGDLWTLRKKGRTAQCILVGHPLGSEARVIVDGDLVRSEHFKEPKQMIDTTAGWRSAFESKGWSTTT